MSARPKSIRLSPNKRAEIISRYEKGEKFDNEDYYVIKDKSGRLNVRRRKQKNTESSDDVKQEELIEEAPAPAPEEPPKKTKKEAKTKAL